MQSGPLQKVTLFTIIALFPALLWAAADNKRPAPLFNDLGDYHAAITTSKPRAQQYFNQGLILAYGFNHAESVRSFRAAQTLDPSCAMCFWGEAFALGPNINKPMDPADVPAAYRAAQEALRLAPAASPREQAMIKALAERYRAEADSDRGPLDQAFADAMATVVEQFPDDLDAASIYAEAMMDTMPWDYYTAEGKAKPLTDTVVAVIESVLNRNPDHVGAIHLYIHIVEASSTPERAEPYADRLINLVPGAGHLVHMPSHIYLRVGRYNDASRVNELASLADESYINQCRAQGFYPALYYPHNIHFLWYTASLEGRSALAIPAARKLADNVPVDLIGDIPLIEQFLTVPMWGLVRFARWDSVLAEPQPRADHRFATAMWHAARGTAFAATARSEEAQQESAAFEAVAAHFAEDSFAQYGYPVYELLNIARHVVSAALAADNNDDNKVVAELQAAIELEDALPYMEPPYWFFPVRQILGQALLQRGRPADAEQVFRADLDKVPNNGWSLQGLARSLEVQGRSDEAASVRGDFERAWENADVAVHAGDVSYF